MLGLSKLTLQIKEEGAGYYFFLLVSYKKINIICTYTSALNYTQLFYSNFKRLEYLLHFNN